MTKVQHTQDEIFVRNPDGIIQKVPRLSKDDTQEVMGVVQAPSSTMTGQIKTLSDTIGKWIPFLTNGYLHRCLGWRGFWGKLWPSIRYQLSATFITQSQSKAIMKLLHKVL